MTMKKYGVYAVCRGSKKMARLIRRYSTLKEAVREAFRLSRRCYHQPGTQENVFIVGDDTGITLSLSGNKYIWYSVYHYKVFDFAVGVLEMSINKNCVQNNFILKEGAICKVG